MNCFCSVSFRAWLFRVQAKLFFWERLQIFSQFLYNWFLQVYRVLWFFSFGVFLCPLLLLLSDQLDILVFGNSTFRLFFNRIESGFWIHRRTLPWTCKIRVKLPQFAQSCSFYLSLQISLVDVMRTWGLTTISIMVSSVRPLVWYIFGIIIYPYLACVSSICFAATLQFSSITGKFDSLSFLTVISPGDTKQSSFDFCILFKTTDWIMFFFFSRHSFVNDAVWVWFSVLSVSILVLVVLWSGYLWFFHSCWIVFQKFVFILSFSVWLFLVFVLSVFRIVQINSRIQSITSNGFKSGRSVIIVGSFFPTLSAFTVVFAAKLTSFY